MKPNVLWLLLWWGCMAVAPCARADAPASVLHFIRESTVDGGELLPTLERAVDVSKLYQVQIRADAGQVEFQFADGYSYYDVGFAAPTGETLKVGDYLDTARYPFQTGTHPGLTLSASANYSEDEIVGNTELGQFHVREISFDANGKLLSFAADFATHNDNDPAGVYGEFRYQSSVPATHPAGSAELSALSDRVFQSEGALTVNVARRGSLHGALTVDYATTDGTAVAGRDYTATAGTLTWADGDKHDKSFTVPILNPGDPNRSAGRFFVRLNGGDAGGQSEAWVDIVNDNPGDTLFHYQSDTGDVVGLGLEKFLSPANGYTISAARNPEGGVSLVIDNTPSVQTGDPNDDETLYVNFAPAAGGTLGVGEYADVQVIGKQKAGHGGFGFSGPSGSHGAAAGEFQVLEAEFDAGGNVTRFAADFTAQYKSGDGVPATHGQVRYHSNAGLPPKRLPQVGAATLYPGTISETSRTPAHLVLTRTGSLSQPLTVVYKVSGDAVAGRDYLLLSGVKTIPANLNSVVVSLYPFRSGRGRGTVTAKLVVKAHAGSYDVGGFKNAKVVIVQGP